MNKYTKTEKLAMNISAAIFLIGLLALMWCDDASAGEWYIEAGIATELGDAEAFKAAPNTPKALNSGCVPSQENDWLCREDIENGIIGVGDFGWCSDKRIPQGLSSNLQFCSGLEHRSLLSNSDIGYGYTGFKAVIRVSW